eukprot:766583-Hanusia_phi.AAC.1
MQNNHGSRAKGEQESSRRSYTNLFGHVYESQSHRRKVVGEVRDSWKDPPKVWRDHIRMQAAAKDWLTSQTAIRQKLRNLLPPQKLMPKATKSRENMRDDVRSRDMNYDTLRKMQVREFTLKRIEQADNRRDGTVSLEALAKAFDIPLPKRTRAASAFEASRRPGQELSRIVPDGRSRTDESDSGSVSTHDLGSEQAFCESQLTWDELKNVFQAFDLERSGRIKIEQFLKFVYTKPRNPESEQVSRVPSSSRPRSARQASSPYSIFDP